MLWYSFEKSEHRKLLGSVSGFRDFWVDIHIFESDKIMLRKKENS